MREISSNHPPGEREADKRGGGGYAPCPARCEGRLAERREIIRAFVQGSGHYTNCVLQCPNATGKPLAWRAKAEILYATVVVYLCG